MRCKYNIYYNTELDIGHFERWQFKMWVLFMSVTFYTFWH